MLATLGLDDDAGGIHGGDGAGAAGHDDVTGVDRGTVLGGADAIAASMRAATGWVHLLGVLISLPGMAQLGRLVCPYVAQHRHQMPGGTDACRID